MKSRQKGKKKGSSKERVFGCDLQDHLQHSGQDVPQVLRSCAEFVEEYGVVDGIYRLSGVSSNIQKLRQEFEVERKPDLRRDVYLQDIHCVSSLCKAYFRELPDPLLTYRLYDKFAEAVAVQLEPERLVKILEVLRELPAPNYRTLEFLMRHLVHMASFSAQTNMHARNLAIVWAPNLLRSKDIEASGFNGTAAFMEVRVQSIVVEFILTHVDRLFGGTALSGQCPGISGPFVPGTHPPEELDQGPPGPPLAGGELESGWRSLPGLRASSSPEDLMPRSLPYHLPSVLQAGDGPPQLRPYHTIIEITEHKRKGSLKVRKWRSIFNLGRSGHETKRKFPRGAEDREDKSDKGTLRPAKSMDSLSAVAGASDEPEALLPPSSPRPSPLVPESLEDDSAEAAEGEPEPEAGALGSTNSEPGTPRPGRSAARAGGGSRAERCAGVHISDPYNVNLPLHITSILNVPPNIISNVSLARLTRGLECPALQPRPSPASGPCPGPGPPDEKSEASPAPGPLADSGPAALAPALEDCLSQEVQDSFSFLEDSSSSEPEWVGAEEGEAAKAGAAGAAGAGAAFSPGEDDPGMGYLEELLRAGPQVEEFSVEPPLDDLSLDEAQFVLAPSCCSPDSPGPGPEAEEDPGEEVFLSAYDELSPLLGPQPPAGEGPRSLEALGQAERVQACWEVEEDKETEHGSRGHIREEAEGSPENKAEAGKAGEGGEAEGGPERVVNLREESGGETEAKEESGGWQEGESMEAAKGVERTGEPGKDKRTKTERQEEAEEGEEAQAEAGRDLEQGAQEVPAAGESWEAVHTPVAEEGRENEGKVRGQRENRDREARADQGDGEDSAEAAEGGAAEASRERESGDGEAEGEQRAGGGHREGGFLLPGLHAVSLEVDNAKEGSAQASETQQAAPQPPWPEEMEPEGQPSPEGCHLCPCPLSSAGSVGMRLASTLVQVQQVRSVPVVPPKPQFAKMPSVMCSKIHVAPANPCPRPGRLDGTPGERARGSRASRSSWRNGGSLSFDAAVALARDRQRTEALGVWRTQTCPGSEDYSLIPGTSPCSMIPAHSPRPLSCLELPPEGTGGSEPRSRFSLPPREPQPPQPLSPPQRRSYAFETQADPGRVRDHD